MEKGNICNQFVNHLNFISGLAQMCGIYAARDRKAPKDAVSTALYRKAGAIPVVVTNVPELCTWWDSSNVAFGATLNPYDSTRGAGGSSGNLFFLFDN